MKTYVRLFLISLGILSATGFYSCQKINSDNFSKGIAEFSLSIPANAVTKSVVVPDSMLYTFQIMVSVTDTMGNAVLTDKLIPLYSFGSEFVSENIELNTGVYKLTKFMVVNTTGAVVYAAPLAGSPMAWLCNRTLPFSFSIQSGQVTKIVPQVLAVGDLSPSQFGYAAFGIQIIKPLEFWTVCILDNPLLMAPTAFTPATLTVYAATGWHYTYKLEAAVNHLVIQGGSALYTFVIEKEGYPAQKIQVGANDLLATTKETPFVLKIPWSGQARTLILQPGPEAGKDAMISNLEPDKNFGDYKYFEATFLSESVLTVMRSNRSLIFFNLDSLPKSAVIQSVKLRLTYDVPIPFDNSYLTDILPSATSAIPWYGGVLQQIVEPWDENKVTWNTQPKTIELNQVFVAPFIRNVNFIELDVTRLIVQISASALPNYGMLFKLWPIEKFPGFRFASSDYADPGMRPKLIINYTL